MRGMTSRPLVKASIVENTQDPPISTIDPETTVAAVTYVISRVEARIYIVLIHCPWLPNANFEIALELKSTADKGDDDRVHARARASESTRGMLQESFDAYFGGKRTEDERGDVKALVDGGDDEGEERTVRRLFRPGAGRAGVAVVSRLEPTRPKVVDDADTKASPDPSPAPHVRSFVEPETHEEDRRRFRPGGGRSGIAITSRVESSRSKLLDDDLRTEPGEGRGAELSTRPIQDLQEQLTLLVSRLRLTTVFDQLRPKPSKKT